MPGLKIANVQPAMDLGMVAEVQSAEEEQDVLEILHGTCARLEMGAASRGWGEMETVAGPLVLAARYSPFVSTSGLLPELFRYPPSLEFLLARTEGNRPAIRSAILGWLQMEDQAWAGDLYQEESLVWIARKLVRNGHLSCEDGLVRDLVTRIEYSAANPGCEPKTVRQQVRFVLAVSDLSKEDLARIAQPAIRFGITLREWVEHPGAGISIWREAIRHVVRTHDVVKCEQLRLHLARMPAARLDPLVAAFLG